MIKLIPLTQIDDNPFQTRAAYPADVVVDLAENIRSLRGARPETMGLIHVPPARAAGDRYQLAAGHCRFRAFRELAAADPEVYGQMPLDLSGFDDQAMADIAWSENQKRKDLTAIEEARALQTAMERFGYTQEQVGDRWGLSRSAVANKLRLLNLPEEAQQAIQRGEISERHGRALLSVQAKSPAVYADVAAEILPVAVSEEAAEQARQVLDGRGGYLENDTARKPGDRCDACGQPVEARAYRTYAYSGDKAMLMCEPCYRAATGWQPPSVRELENIIKVAERRMSRNLAHATFPLDVQVGEGDSRIHAARCTECPYRYEDGSSEICGDQKCFMAKAENWKGYQQIRVSEALRARYGDVTIRFSEGYNGYDLETHDDVDVAMVRAGVCVPGKCDRLRMRYYAHETESYIYPVPGLPFVYNCDNSNSHAACQRRYLRTQQTEEDIRAEDRAKEAERDRKRQAYALRDRAAVAVARALLAGETYPQLWGVLARRLDAGVPDPGQSVQESARRIAAKLLGRAEAYVGDWSHKTACERYEHYLADQMHQLGVGITQSLDGLRAKLKRIRGFLLDDGGQIRPALTGPQRRGNDDNLRELLASAAGLAQAGLATQTEYTGFAAQVQELREALRATMDVPIVSRETPPMPAGEPISGGNGRSPAAMWAPQPKNRYLAHYWTCDPDIELWESACGQIGHGDDGNGGNWQPEEDTSLKRCRTCERVVNAREEAS